MIQSTFFLGVGGVGSKQASKQQVVSSIPFQHHDAQYSHSFIDINPANFFDCKREAQTNSKALLMKTTKWTNGKQK
jgi:hypothetical protein